MLIRTASILALAVSLSACLSKKDSDSETDTRPDDFALPSAAFDVANDSPVGIWLIKSTGLESGSKTRGDLAADYEDGDVIESTWESDVFAKEYIVVTATENTGEYQAQSCGYNDLIIKDNNISRNDSDSESEGDYSETSSQILSLDIVDNQTLSGTFTASSVEKGTTDETSAYVSSSETRFAIEGLKLSDSTEFHDFYEYNFDYSSDQLTTSDDIGEDGADVLCAYVSDSKERAKYDGKTIKADERELIIETRDSGADLYFYLLTNEKSNGYLTAELEFDGNEYSHYCDDNYTNCTGTGLPDVAPIGTVHDVNSMSFVAGTHSSMGQAPSDLNVKFKLQLSK